MASQSLRKDLYEPQNAQAATPTARPRYRVQTDPDAAARSRDRLKALATLVLVTAFALFILSRYATIMVNNYNLEGMQASLNKQASLNASLQAQVTELASPSRILNYAENILKMQPATPVQVGAATP